MVKEQIITVCLCTYLFFKGTQAKKKEKSSRRWLIMCFVMTYIERSAGAGLLYDNSSVSLELTSSLGHPNYIKRI